MRTDAFALCVVQKRKLYKIYDNEFKLSLTADTSATLKDPENFWIHFNLKLLLLLELGVPLLDTVLHPVLEWLADDGVY